MGLGEFNGGVSEQIHCYRGLDATGKSTQVENQFNNATKLSCPPEIMIPSITEGSARTHLIFECPTKESVYCQFPLAKRLSNILQTII